VGIGRSAALSIVAIHSDMELMRLNTVSCDHELNARSSSGLTFTPIYTGVMVISAFPAVSILILHSLHSVHNTLLAIS